MDYPGIPEDGAGREWTSRTTESTQGVELTCNSIREKKSMLEALPVSPAENPRSENKRSGEENEDQDSGKEGEQVEGCGVRARLGRR